MSLYQFVGMSLDGKKKINKKELITGNRKKSYFFTKNTTESFVEKLIHLYLECFDDHT